METPRELAQKLVNNRVFTDNLANLYDRWEDEKMYEDWKDYERNMKSLVEVCSGIDNPKNVKGTKRPFGVKFDYEGYTIHIFVKIQGNYLTVSGKITKIL